MNKDGFFEPASISDCQTLVGGQSNNLKLIAELTSTSLTLQGNRIYIDGARENIEFVHRILKELHGLVKEGQPIQDREIEYCVDILRNNDDHSLRSLFMKKLFTNTKNKAVKPISISQALYVQSIEQSDLVFGIGPAGTGKTYLAVTMAFVLLNQKYIDKIILTRPAVEAGEQLGFLPGDLYEKIQPYLRPLYDAAHEMIGIEKTADFIKKGIIEIAPLAYMRGRTLNNSFIILDEAQNTTSQQMKMFLTRLGVNSRTVITGDITQIDLPSKTVSGLVEASKILTGIKDISFQYFSDRDVVRHRLVKQIIRAYDEYEKREG